MSRELQIIDALVELSVNHKEVDLELIRAFVQRHQKSAMPETWKQVARQTLRSLAGLGMVQIEKDANGRLHYEKVKLTELFLSSDAVKAAFKNEQKPTNRRDDRPDDHDRDDNLRGSVTPGIGGGGDQSGNGSDGSDEGDGGGGGFREVLSHPFLFSLSKTDFEDILNQI